jgi:hypothetical protein
MSLVYEALQKAEREKQRKTGAAPASPLPVAEARPISAPTPVPVAAPAAPRSYQPLLLGLIGCVCIVALVAILYLVSNSTKPAPATATTVTNTVITTAAAPSAVASELPPLNPIDARFRISGIMRDSEGKFGAVLNGKIVYEGYYVDGATVKSITQDRAVLDIGGKEAVVRLY